MAKIHTAKEMAKMILTEPKDFNLDSFCKTEVGSFFERILEYLKSHASPYQSHFLKQTKCMNPQKIIEAITKIVPKFNPTLLENVSLEVIAKCFTFFIHPDTPEPVRTPCVQLYLNILSAVRPEWISRMDEANVCIIPFNRFARTRQETEAFEKYITKKFKSIVIYDKPQGTQEDCINNLIKTYQWINQNWMYGPQYNRDFLFKYIFAVIYHKIALDAGYTETPYGFDSQVIEEFHVKTLRFFNDCYEDSSQLDITSMFETKPLMTIVIKILEVTKQFNNASNAIATLTFYTKLMGKTDLIDHLISVDKELFLTIPSTAAEITEKYISKECSDADKNNVINQFQQFSLELFNMLYDKLKDDLYTFLHKYFKELEPRQRIAAFVFAAFVQRLMLKHVNDPKSWTFIMELAKDSDMYSAIACKYAQMFAVMQIPVLLEIQQILDDSISYCSSFFDNRVKDTHPEKYEFFIDNLENVIDNPETIVMQSLKSMWQPLDSFDDTFEGISLPPPPISSLADDEFGEFSASFISPFDCYSDAASLDERRRLFAPIITYYSTLDVLSTVPPGLQCNVTTVFDYSRKRLFRAVLNESDSLIVQRTAEVIKNLISHEEVCQKLNNESLTCLYSTIILLLLRNDEKLKMLGSELLTISFRNSIVGMTCLLPFFMALLETDKIAVSDDVIDILSSIPLFSVDHTLPAEISSLVTKTIARDASLYIDVASECLKRPGTNLRKRLIDFIFTKLKANSGQDAVIVWNYLLAVIPPLLTDEMSQPKPDHAIFAQIFTALSEACKLESSYAVAVIRSGMMMVPAIAKIAPEEMRKFIDSLAGIAVGVHHFDLDFSIDFIEVVVLLFIYNFELMKKENSYRTFVKALYREAMAALKSSSSTVSLTLSASAPVIGSNELATFCASMLKMLSIYFGAFPFANSIQYPTSKAEGPDAQNTILTRAGYVLELTSTDSGAFIASQTPVGRFVWETEPVNNTFYKSEPPQPATLPPNTKTPPTQFKAQEDLERSVSPLMASFESDLGELPLFEFPDGIDMDGDQRFEDEYKALLSDFNNSKPDPLVPFRPPNAMENTKAGFITSFGLFRPSHPHDIREVPVEQCGIPLHRLSTTNHRVQQKIGVVFIGRETSVEDYVAALGTQIEETSPLFREFVHELGWPVDLETHVGYDAELETDTERTGRTAIYYADFSRELMFHVPALFGKNAIDRTQSLRKRYISNDRIVIVWKEAKAPFDPTVMYQKPHILYILMTPTDTDTVRVELIARSDFTLHDGRRGSAIYLSKGQLAAYIRSTCILVQEQSARSEKEWEHPVSRNVSTLLQLSSSASHNKTEEYTAISSIMQEQKNVEQQIAPSSSQETYW